MSDLGTIKNFFLRLCESIGSLARERKVNPLCWNTLNRLFLDVADKIRNNGNNNPKDLIRLMNSYWNVYESRKEKNPDLSVDEFIDKFSAYILDRFSRNKNYVLVRRDGFNPEIAFVYLSHKFSEDDIFKYHMTMKPNNYYLVLLPDRTGPQPVLKSSCSSDIFVLKDDEHKYLIDLLSRGDSEYVWLFSNVLKNKPADSEYQLMRYKNNRSQYESVRSWFEREAYLLNL